MLAAPPVVILLSAGGSSVDVDGAVGFCDSDDSAWPRAWLCRCCGWPFSSCIWHCGSRRITPGFFGLATNNDCTKVVRLQRSKKQPKRDIPPCPVTRRHRKQEGDDERRNFAFDVAETRLQHQCGVESYGRSRRSSRRVHVDVAPEGVRDCSRCFEVQRDRDGCCVIRTENTNV
jgi:hypothetical protein